MSEPLLTKRLHISGLTSSITPADLERRLSSFGKIKEMNGFGARDALGDPRKFGFVTMEIGAKELAKCLNVLSGSTWKGAKLRIGEAKLDFRERLAKFGSQPARPVRPKKTRARNHGYPSSTLPLIPLSATTAASTPGWIVTPSGRVVRPMRMRPERPLEPIRNELGTSKVKGMSGKVKKRIKPPPIRARRRLIDPTKWDSVYLKGVFLDAVPISLPTSKDALKPPSLERDDIMDEDEEGTDEDGDRLFAPALVQNQSPQTVTAGNLRIHEPTESIDIRDEANAALAMLGEMFGGKEDWEGKESVDGMEERENDEASDEEIQLDKEDGIEVVPSDFRVSEGSKTIKKDKGKGKEKSVADIVRFDREDEVGVEVQPDRDDVEMEENDTTTDIGVSAQTEEPIPQTDLKTLFAPREDASFSLINHLDFDLDLDFDADILGVSAPSGAPYENVSQPILSIPQVVEIPAAKSTTKACSRVTLDPSLPLLFPSLDSLPHPHPPSSNLPPTGHKHGTPSCILFPSAARVRGLYHLPPSNTFTRSPQDTPESIRERWEKDKVSLTHEWKKAWREARGSRKGRVGAGSEIGGGY